MSNPLISAYRKPTLYISLPSGGQYYDPKPKLSVDGELAIYAMTARDELISKTPDALFNGEATAALITSCCPDIANATQIPINDLLVILLGIRQASYGRSLDVDVKCPECEEMNMLSLDGARLLGAFATQDHSNKLELDNKFTVHVKPYNLEDRTLLQIQQVKQRKMIDDLTSEEIPEGDRADMFGRTFIDIAELTIELIANCIYAVKAPESEEITDSEMIKEWLQSITKADYDVIKERVDELSDSGFNSKFKAQCQSCEHTWETDIDLDIANFFEG
jgi:hypothetical protein|tara:strand:+ start:3868 stop:4698 length:831 start_codon:yes stop_codon:yes gene_type:complete